jgi:serine phosphatase RsbU (regulator of sigma subunit)
VFDPRTPHSTPTFLVDGAVAGTWSYERGRVEVEPFERLARSAQRELREEAARAAGELEAARRIQMGLLPDTAVFDGERRFALRALVHPARTVGGDFYDCFKLDEKRLFFVVADVSGKGMPAALFMALCKATIKAAAMSEGAAPAAVLRLAAQEIARDNPETFFVTVFAGTLELETGELLYCNAGHEPPYVRASGGVHRLPTAPRPPVGVPGGFSFTSQSLRLAPGDSLCALTDGVTEAMNARRQMFDEERLSEVLRRSHQLPPEQIIGRIIEAVTNFCAGVPQTDDITLVVIKREGGVTG